MDRLKQLQAFRHENARSVLISHKLIYSQILRTVLIFAYAKKQFCGPRFALNNG